MTKPFTINSVDTQSLEPTTQLHRAARAYAKMGREIFPCGVDDPGIADPYERMRKAKAPLTANGFKDATTELAQIDLWWGANPNANIGFSPGTAGLCVIDTDPPKAEDADQTHGRDHLFNLELNNSFLPQTYKVSTPRGGDHLYFKGSLPGSASKLGPHIDTRGEGSYVLLPPSVVCGKAYEVVHKADVAPLPEWVPDLLVSVHMLNKPAADVDLDTPANIERAKDFLKKRSPAIKGQGGNLHTYVTAAILREHGISEELAPDLMEEWNDTCVPPWDNPSEEYATVIHNGYKYAKRPGASAVGSLKEDFAEQLAAEIASLPPREPDPDKPGVEISFSTLDDLLAAEPTPVAELIPDLIEKHRATFLAGPGGTHKSRLGIQWGLSLAAGRSVWGKAVDQVNKPTFVYLSYEDDDDEIKRRVHAITNKLELPRRGEGRVQYHDQFATRQPLAKVDASGALTVQEFGTRFKEHLKSTNGHKFLVIDSTYNAIRFSGSTKIDEDAVLGAIGWLEQMCRETDTSILILWHPSEAGEERGDASGWSVAWKNGPRARLSIKRDRDRPDAFILENPKRNHAARAAPLTLHFDNGILRPIVGGEGGEHKDVVLMNSAARVAILAAEHNAPINGRGYLKDWQIQEMQKDVGYRPSQKEAKEALASALFAGSLIRLNTSRHHAAGYYPPNPDQANEMARSAKNVGQDGDAP